MTSPQRIIANELIREQPRYYIGVLSWPQCVEVIAANIAAALIDAGHLPAPETHTRYMNNRGTLARSPHVQPSSSRLTHIGAQPVGVSPVPITGTGTGADAERRA